MSAGKYVERDLHIRKRENNVLMKRDLKRDPFCDYGISAGKYVKRD